MPPAPLGLEFDVQYAANKSAKHPKWSDGILRRTGTKIELFTENRTRLESVHYSGAIAVDEELSEDAFARYRVTVLAVRGQQEQDMFTQPDTAVFRALPVQPPRPASPPSRRIGLSKPKQQPVAVAPGPALAPQRMVSYPPSQPSGPPPRVLVVQYTKQKTKVKKVWQDGTLIARGRQAVLKDDKGKQMEAFLIGKDPGELEEDEELESDGFLVRIAELDAASAALRPSKPPSPPPYVNAGARRPFKAPALVKRPAPTVEEQKENDPPERPRKEKRVSWEQKAEEEEEEEEEQEQESVRAERERQQRLREEVGREGFSFADYRDEDDPPAPRARAQPAPQPTAQQPRRPKRDDDGWVHSSDEDEGGEDGGYASASPQPPAAAAAPPPAARPSTPSSAPGPRLALRFPSQADCGREAPPPPELPDTYPCVEAYRAALIGGLQAELSAQLHEVAGRFWRAVAEAEKERGTTAAGAGGLAVRRAADPERIRQLCGRLGDGARYHSSCQLLPPWVPSHPGARTPGPTARVAGLNLLLAEPGHNSEYMKDDLWVISTKPTLDAGVPPSGAPPQNTPSTFTILARSGFHGGPREGKVELKPVGEWPAFTFGQLQSRPKVYALRAISGCHELALAENAEAASEESLPVLPALLRGDPSGAPSDSLSLSKLPPGYVEAEAVRIADGFRLNDDQRRVLRVISEWFSPPTAASDAAWGRDGEEEEDWRWKREGPIALVHGVFGAGKSHLLTAVVVFLAHLSAEEERRARRKTPPLRVLVASNTNVAVDRVLLGLLKAGFTDFIRVGSIPKIAREVLPHTVVGSDERALKEAIRDLEKLRAAAGGEEEMRALDAQIAEAKDGRLKLRLERLKKAPVVGVTCHSALNQALDGARFDVVLLDECSQVTEPLSLLPIARFHSIRLVLVGDPQQLPPQLTAEGGSEDRPRGLAKTMFVRLQRAGLRPVLLATQYRCHPGLSGLANGLFYGGRLRDGVRTADRPPVAPGVAPLLAFDSRGSREEKWGGSWANREEATAARHAIQTLTAAGVSPSEIGVVCLYKGQVELIRRTMGCEGPGPGRPNAARHGAMAAAAAEVPQISTVDAFQGAEKDVIIVSCSRTQRGSDFLCDARRVNVTITRARRHLVVLGAYDVLSSLPFWKDILEAARRSQGGYRRLEDVRGLLETSPLPPAAPAPAPAPVRVGAPWANRAAPPRQAPEAEGPKHGGSAAGWEPMEAEEPKADGEATGVFEAGWEDAHETEPAGEEAAEEQPAGEEEVVGSPPHFPSSPPPAPALLSPPPPPPPRASSAAPPPGDGEADFELDDDLEGMLGAFGR